VARGLLCWLALAPIFKTNRRFWFGLCVAAWLGVTASGLSVLVAYENRPGHGASAPRSWPITSALVRAADRPTLVFFAHPQCDCTRASLTELQETLARTQAPPKTYVLFLKPDAFAAGWDKTDLWTRASGLPGVTVVSDTDGTEARLFGAATSGQALLYRADGKLAFAGGITGARGHVGDNLGQAALASFLSDGRADRSAASVFGCPLFASQLQ
jgi:hypothetical protein